MYVVISYLTFLGIAVHGMLIPLFFWLDYDVLALVNVFSTAAWLAARDQNHKGHHTSAILILIGEVSVHTSLALYYLGWHSGFQYYLMSGVPFILFNHKVRTAPLLFLSALLCLLFMSLYALTEERVYHYDYPALIEVLNYLNMVVSFLALTLTSYFFRVASFISEQQMELLANADQLTGLPNRRGMLTRLNTQHSLSQRNGSVFSLVLADLDHFKRFNDTYGHDCGDYVLKEVARLLKQRLRHYDAVSRWGGEEFLFMFPETGIASAKVIAGHLRKLVEARCFEFNGQPLHVTMTFGVAEHRQNNSIDYTIKQADDALYLGKEAGRNRVVDAQSVRPAQAVDTLPQQAE
jgi:diguanylate cyclase (GGDEF)-like protein